MLTDEFVSYLFRMNVYNLGGGTRLEKTYLVRNEASINLAWVDKGLWIEATGCLVLFMASGSFLVWIVPEEKPVREMEKEEKEFCGRSDKQDILSQVTNLNVTVTLHQNLINLYYTKCPQLTEYTFLDRTGICTILCTWEQGKVGGHGIKASWIWKVNEWVTHANTRSYPVIIWTTAPLLRQRMAQRPVRYVTIH